MIISALDSDMSMDVKWAGIYASFLGGMMLKICVDELKTSKLMSLKQVNIKLL